MNQKVSAMYFSPTKTTEKVVLGIAEELSKSITEGAKCNVYDFTLPESRNRSQDFTENDIVIFGVPVYAARVPNVLLKYLKTIAGNGALAVAVTVYGNRNYDDALIELTDILSSANFKVIAAAAFIGEHSFSQILGKNRPDEQDMKIAAQFAAAIKNKIIHNDINPVAAVKGNRPYRHYYIPKNINGDPVDIKKAKPKTNDLCINCNLCAEICPMGSIDKNDITLVTGICIKCGACIKRCPRQAKYYDDEKYIYHKEELEVNFSARKEPELFL